MKNHKGHLGLKIFLIGSVFLISIFFVWALSNGGHWGYSVNNSTMTAKVNYAGVAISTAVSYIKEHNICRVASNSDSYSAFVPTKTAGEYNAFVNNAPSGVSLESCGCSVNADCPTGQSCIGYEAAVYTCQGTYKEVSGGSCTRSTTYSSTCMEEDNPCSTRTEETCDSDTYCHLKKLYSCSWTTTTTTKSCGGLTQSVCGTKVGCSWKKVSDPVLGECQTTIPPTGTTSCIAGTPPSCFVAGTKVLGINGLSYNIEDVNVGNHLLGTNNTIHTVEQVKKVFYPSELYSINGSDYFVTASHPFMTLEGWKSFDPMLTKQEVPNLLVTKLTIGDIFVTVSGFTRLHSFDSKISPQYVYNFVLDGDHTYYANGYLVHNKLINGGSCIYNVSCGSSYCVNGKCSSPGDPSVYSCCPCSTTAQCPVGYTCTSGKCSKSGVTCASLPMVGACGECVSTAQCPVNYSCKIYGDVGLCERTFGCSASNPCTRCPLR